MAKYMIEAIIDRKELSQVICKPLTQKREKKS